MNILFFLHPKAELAFIYDYHTVRQAMEIMEHYKYSCVPILNRAGKYVGTITEGDQMCIRDRAEVVGLFPKTMEF